MWWAILGVGVTFAILFLTGAIKKKSAPEN